MTIFRAGHPGWRRCSSLKSSESWIAGRGADDAMAVVDRPADVMARPNFLRPLVEGPAEGLALCVEGAARPVATALEPALDRASRRRGLLGRDGLPEGAALVIAPSNSVHTFFMRFPIDLIFAARDGRVLKLRHGVPARRLSAALRAYAVIEMAAGSIDRAGLRVGDRLSVVRRQDPGRR